MKRIKTKNKKGFKRKKNLNRNKNKYCKFTADDENRAPRDFTLPNQIK